MTRRSPYHLYVGIIAFLSHERRKKVEKFVLREFEF
jgi:hypothetical protein